LNFRLAVNAFIVLLSLALISYGFSDALNAALGVEASVFNEAWKLVALALGGALLTGYAYPFARGVRKGDRLMAFVNRKHSVAGQLVSVSESVPVIALEAGRVGSKIKLRLLDGLHAEGVIQNYAGTLTPPVVQLTESEVRSR
jgi:hypothetical protein